MKQISFWWRDVVPRSIVVMSLCAIPELAQSTLPIPPKHSPKDKVELSEIVFLGKMVDVTCRRLDPGRPGQWLDIKVGDCGSHRDAVKIIGVAVERVFCNVDGVHLPSIVQISWPSPFISPKALKSQMMGQGYIFFVKQALDAAGNKTLERPFVVPAHNYTVYPEPELNIAEFRDVFATCTKTIRKPSK